MSEWAASYPQLLGHVVRGRRMLVEMSLAEMAASVGLKSASGWSRVETGDTTMTVSQLRKAAHVLGTTPAELVRDADELVVNLEAAGVLVHDETPKEGRKWLLGGAALLAVVASAAALSRRG